jgi:hypothetical protein
MKKDNIRRFCGDYKPLNAPTWQDSFPMPLINDALDQLGESSLFPALDFQSRFWQIPMALEDIKNIAMISKSRLYE